MMLTKNYHMYPAILDYLTDDGDVRLIFPDFKEEMEKKDVFIGKWYAKDDEVYEAATSYLFELIYNRVPGCDECYDESNLPKPTSIRNIQLKEGQRSILVVVPQISYGCDGIHLYVDNDTSRLRFGPKLPRPNNKEDDGTQIIRKMEELLRSEKEATMEKLKELFKASTEEK